MYCFGHIHEGYGVEMITWKDDRTLVGKDAIESQIVGDHNVYPLAEECRVVFGKETVMVNAAIMSYTYKPTQVSQIWELLLACFSVGFYTSNVPCSMVTLSIYDPIPKKKIQAEGA